MAKVQKWAVDDDDDDDCPPNFFSFICVSSVYENRVLRTIFGPRRDEVTGEWRNLHNEELRDLYFSQSILSIIQSRRMRWAGQVARMGGEEERV
jgi:hypothetical protein